jgi:hypothetical protein
LDGSGRGIIKLFAPNNAYTASHEAGLDFLIKQRTRQAIMAILVQYIHFSVFCFCFVVLCKSLHEKIKSSKFSGVLQIAQ